jgi:phage-related protein
MEARQKPILWLQGEVKTPPFSQTGRVEAGMLLRRLQRGEKLSMPSSRAMPAIGPGCHELRIIDRQANWRIVHFIDADAIVILEVFAKKTGRTPVDVVSNCKRRLKAYKASVQE